jgi:exodeoxyribonuclease VII small subunit
MAKKNDAAGSAEVPASFESALKELESLVATLESGSLSLEQSLAAHKRGLELARYCQSALTQAQQQVRILEEEALRAFPSDDTQS